MFLLPRPLIVVDFHTAVSISTTSLQMITKSGKQMMLCGCCWREREGFRHNVKQYSPAQLTTAFGTLPTSRAAIGSLGGNRLALLRFVWADDTLTSLLLHSAILQLSSFLFRPSLRRGATSKIPGHHIVDHVNISFAAKPVHLEHRDGLHI